MYIVLAHTYNRSGAGLQVAKRNNGEPALYGSKSLAATQADRWNDILGKTGLTRNRFYQVYRIGD